MVADFNNDGDLDAAVANYCIDNSCTGSIAVFLGNGDGTFRPGSEITTPQLTNTIATGDFNGDGYADLASTSYYGHLIVLLNRGDGYFDLTHDYADSSVSSSVTAGDFNSDGKIDLITGNICESGCSGGWLYFFAGRGDGSFAAPKKRVTTVAPLALASSDFNKDGLDFLLLGSEAHVFLNRGGGRFRELTYPSVSGSAMTLGDLNGDGVQDVAYVDGIGAGVMLGRPNGAFKPLSRFAVPFPAYGLAIGDFNANGKSDVAVSDYDSSMYGSISLLLGTTDGTLQAAQEYVVPSTAMSFLVSDVNGDGMQDVLVGSSGILGANLSVLIARGYHNFASPVNYPLTGGPRELAVADFNHDGLHRCGCAMQRAEA